MREDEKGQKAKFETVEDTVSSDDAALLVRAALEDDAPFDHEVCAARRRAHLALFGEFASDQPQRDGLDDGPPRLGRYELRQLVGRGGMGSVFRARDPVLDRKVAIKVLHRQAFDDDDTGQLLVNEASAMARLRHPNVISVYDVGIDDGTLFLAMEFVEGETLRRWQQRPGNGWRAVLRKYIAAGRGLQAAHAAGLVHGDFKPDNVLIGDDGRVLVSDFSVGIVGRVTNADAASTLRDSAGTSDTQRQRIPRVGTRAYLAPELRRNASNADDEPGFDARSDQYAFCVALHEGLFGARPDASRPAARGRVPAGIRDLVRRGHAEDPRQRHPDMASLLDALERRLRRPRRVVFGLVGSVVLLLAVALGAMAVRAQADATCTARLPDVRSAWADARPGLAANLTGGARADVLAQMDEFATQWDDAVEKQCQRRSTGADVTGQGVEACLLAAAGSFEAALDLLSTEGLDPYDAWVSTVVALPEPSRCHLGPGEHEMVADGVRNQAAAAAVGLRVQRRYQEALEADEKLFMEAMLEKDYIVMATMMLEQSRNLRALGRNAEAMEKLDEAIMLAEAAEVRRVLLTALGERSMIGVNMGEPGDDLRNRAHRAALLAERLGDPVASLQAHMHMGYAELRSGEAESAIEIESAALARAEEQLGEEHLELAYAHDFLGAAYAEAGRADEALRHKRRALVIAEARLGPEHSDLAMLLLTSGRIHVMVGERALARDLFERALELRRATHGSRHARVRTAERTLAQWWANEGDLGRALAHLGPPNGVELTADERWRQGALGASLCLDHGRRYEASDWLRVAENALGSDGDTRARVQIVALRARIDADVDPASATADARAAVALASTIGDPRASFLAELAALEVALLADDPDEVRRYGTTVRTGLDDVLGLDPATRARAHWLDARAATAEGRSAALPLRSATYEAERGLGPNHPLRATIERSNGMTRTPRSIEDG